MNRALNRTLREKQNTETVDCIRGSSGDNGQVNDSVQVISKLMPAYIIKKIITTTPYAESLTRVSDRDHGILADQTIPVGAEPQQKEAAFRRQGAHQYSEARRFEALSLITVLPYLQGMLLYVLAVIYPFFCLM